MPAIEPPRPCAFVFPGQGAQEPAMLEHFAPGDPLLAQVEQIAGVRLAEAGAAVWSRNLESSLVTVAASLRLLDTLGEEVAPPAAVAGYSIGQWVALHAAGALGREALLGFVAARARIMDEVTQEMAAHGGPAGMITVIGAPIDALEALCGDAQAQGGELYLANLNAPSQATLSGCASGLAFAEARLPALHPKVMRRLDVAGPWHSPLMAAAAERLRPLVAGLRLRRLTLPVIDNVTGGWLPQEPDLDRLAAHVASPVRWAEGIRTLRTAGVASFLEVGHGDMLSRFGFFIDRGAAHIALAPSTRRRP